MNFYLNPFEITESDKAELLKNNIAILETDYIFELFIRYLNKKLNIPEYQDFHKFLFIRTVLECANPDNYEPLETNDFNILLHIQNIYRTYIKLYCDDVYKQIQDTYYIDDNYQHNVYGRYNEILKYPFTKDFHEYLLQTDYYKTISSAKIKVFHNFTFRNYEYQENNEFYIYDFVNKQSYEENTIYTDFHKDINFGQQFLIDFNIKNVITVDNGYTNIIDVVKVLSCLDIEILTSFQFEIETFGYNFNAFNRDFVMDILYNLSIQSTYYKNKKLFDIKTKINKLSELNDLYKEIANKYNSFDNTIPDENEINYKCCNVINFNILHKDIHNIKKQINKKISNKLTEFVEKQIAENSEILKSSIQKEINDNNNLQINAIKSLIDELNTLKENVSSNKDSIKSLLSDIHTIREKPYFKQNEHVLSSNKSDKLTNLINTFQGINYLLNNTPQEHNTQNETKANKLERLMNTFENISYFTNE